MASLENTMGGVMAELHRLQSLVAQQAQHAQNSHFTQNDGLQYVPPPPLRPNLNLPEPPRFSGTPSELPSFQLKLCQFLRGNFNTSKSVDDVPFRTMEAECRQYRDSQSCTNCC